MDDTTPPNTPDVEVTRRGLFRAGAAGVGIFAASGLFDQGIAAAAVRGVRGVPAKATLAKVITRGNPEDAGYSRLAKTAGEAHGVRSDLGIAAKKGRARRRKAMLAFVQLSDVHVVDAQSPMRLEWADRFDDPGDGPTLGLFSSAYRAHEMLTGHVADSMVRAINAVKYGPVTGKRLALAIQTGDNSDNSQLNEIRWNIDVLDGSDVRFDSGDLTKWEGVADGDPDTYDIAYWHPDGTPDGKDDDRPRQLHGFPTMPGLLDAARAPFRAEGLNMPWYSAFGNHDGLVQGLFPSATLPLNQFAVGSRKIVTPPADLTPGKFVSALLGDPASLIAMLSDMMAAPTGVRDVTPDPDRRFLSRKQVVEQHFTTSGLPVGHGFTKKNRTEGTAYYHFDRGQFRFIVMDSVNPNGNADGSLPVSQFTWLTKLLAKSKDKIVLLFSHHTSQSMSNAGVGTGGDNEERVLGNEVLSTLLANKRVIAWVNGHTHTNTITPHKRPKGGGLWEITTASHIDWPQQARIIEIADNRDGTLSIFTTMLDHAGLVAPDPSTHTPRGLAGLSRELAANDYQHGGYGTGAPADRNVELIVGNPLT